MAPSPARGGGRKVRAGEGWGGGGWGALLLAAALLAGCRSRAGPAPPAPVVEYSGCFTVSLPGPVCVLYPHPEIKLWVQADPGLAVEIRAGERLLPTAGEEVKGGLRFKVFPSAGASSLIVRLRVPDGTRGPPWSLTLARPEAPAWRVEVQKLQHEGRTTEIRQLLAQQMKVAPRSQQGSLLRSLAVLAQNDGNVGEAADDLKQGIAVDREQGLLNDEVEKEALLAQIYLGKYRFDDARRALPSELPAGAPADAQYRLSYYQGLLAEKVGDYGSALERLQEAADLAERVGMVQYRWIAEQVLARVLQEVGRTKEAAKLFARLRVDPHPEKKCDIGILLTNEAWSGLLAREGGEKADPVPMLEAARRVYDDEGCPATKRLNVRLNLALAHQQEEHWRAARRDLDEAAALASPESLEQRLWWLDLEARQVIAEGSPMQALHLYDDLAALAERSLSPEGRFRAAVGRARARLRLAASGERKQKAAAIADLAAADRLIDEQSWQIPADEGRDTFIAQREEATRLYLGLLLESGRRQDAFDLVRRARSRLLRQLTVWARLARLTPKERETWERSLSRYWALRNETNRQAAEEWRLPGDQRSRAEESRALQLAQARKELDHAMAAFGGPAEGSLSPPAPGEVILAYHPLPRGWVGFAAQPGRVEVTTFELPAGALTDSAALAHRLLEPFRRSLAGAGRVRVLPYGVLRSVDFHSLPVDREPLLARHLVVYSLDLPARPAGAPPDRRVALLVADPKGDLPAARQEAQAVDTAVHAWGSGWTVTRLDSSDALAETVRGKLPGVGLFHFAGHGSFAGLGGWDSELRLADGSLTVGDILALHPVPSWVVLAACDAAHPSEQAPGEGIGLAQAFLLAGSRAVIAATRPVPDRTARDLIRELYRGWRPEEDLPRQFQRAELACRQQDPPADCASFRLLEP